MRRYDTRVTLTVPRGTKAEWTAKATARGITLSAFLREVTDRIVDEHRIEIAVAKLEGQMKADVAQ